MTKIQFVPIRETQDFYSIKEIYDYYIEHSTAILHTEKQSIEQIQKNIFVGHPKYVSFLIKDNTQTIGFCYLAPFNTRNGYDKTATLTLYLQHRYTKKGIGQQTLLFLEQIAQERNITVLVATISGENKSSIRLFEKMNYQKCGHFKSVAEKFGKVVDIVYYQKIFSS